MGYKILLVVMVMIFVVFFGLDRSIIHIIFLYHSACVLVQLWRALVGVWCVCRGLARGGGEREVETTRPNREACIREIKRLEVATREKKRREAGVE